MLTDSRIVLPRPTRPLTFTGLMTLYESNYVRLGWLLPDLQSLDAQRVSSPDTDLPLHARLLERARYTTTIRASATQTACPCSKSARLLEAQSTRLRRAQISMPTFIRA